MKDVTAPNQGCMRKSSSKIRLFITVRVSIHLGVAINAPMSFPLRRTSMWASIFHVSGHVQRPGAARSSPRQPAPSWHQILGWAHFCSRFHFRSRCILCQSPVSLCRKSSEHACIPVPLIKICCGSSDRQRCSAEGTDGR